MTTPSFQNATAYTDNAFASSLTQASSGCSPFNVGTDATCILAMVRISASSTPNCTGVTFDGNAMTLVATQEAPLGLTGELTWWKYAPGSAISSTKNWSVTADSGLGKINVLFVSYATAGAATAGSYLEQFDNSLDTTSISSAVGDIVAGLGICYAGSGTPGLTPSSPTVQRYDATLSSGSTVAYVVAEEDGASSVVLSGTADGSSTGWGMLPFSIAASGGGGPTAAIKSQMLLKACS